MSAGSLRRRFLLALGAPALACASQAPPTSAPPASTQTGEPVEVAIAPPPPADAGTVEEDGGKMPDRQGGALAAVWQPEGAGTRMGCVRGPLSANGTSMVPDFPGCPWSLPGAKELSADRPPQIAPYEHLTFSRPLTQQAKDAGSPDACCYTVRPRIVKGRPLRSSGQVCLPEWFARSSVSLQSGSIDLPPTARRWQEAALLEHASVPAFAVLAMRLSSLGAPARLIRACHRAARDELGHAQDCLRVARAAGATPSGNLGIAASLISCSLTQSRDIDSLLHETFWDACVGETEAALLAERLVSEPDSDDPPEAHAVHVRIATEEARHAELGWRILSWLAQRFPDQGRRLLHAAKQDLEADADCTDPQETHARQIARQQVVAPCIKQLLATLPEPQKLRTINDTSGQRPLPRQLRPTSS